MESAVVSREQINIWQPTDNDLWTLKAASNQENYTKEAVSEEEEFQLPSILGMDLFTYY
jgi:hypothetical protein